MAEEQKSKLFRFGIIPKCPFYKTVNVMIILVLIAIGTWGTYYFHFWAAIGYLIYSLVFYFLVMPLTMCRYCFFKVTETAVDKEKGKATKKLLSKEEWSKSHLPKHVGQKHWVWFMFMIWLAPIVLIIISFFRNFNYLAIIALIIFIAVLVGNFFYMIKIKCPNCPIQEECHSSF